MVKISYPFVMGWNCSFRDSRKTCTILCPCTNFPVTIGAAASAAEFVEQKRKLVEA